MSGRHSRVGMRAAHDVGIRIDVLLLVGRILVGVHWRGW